MTKAIEINCETGEVIERPLTEEELNAQATAQIKANEHLTEMAQISEKRSKLLSRLGITEEEAKLLLG